MNGHGFTQAELDPAERQRIFDGYFAVFPWASLPADGGEGADIGCGSGRWAALVAPRVRRLHAVDASEQALGVARENLRSCANVEFHRETVGQLSMADGSLDFAYSLGVLHHVPDTAGAIRQIVAKLKPGAPFLVYLYYAFDNRPLWYRLIWRMSDALRAAVSRMPMPIRYVMSQVMAMLVYWPLARSAKLLEKIACLPASWPLGFYRNMSFYTMRTDALDRFGTRLEKRFTRKQIAAMLEEAGFEQVRFSEAPPYWVGVGMKRG